MGDIKQNKLMKGVFTKINYKDENTAFNGIYIGFEIENSTCEVKDKRNYVDCSNNINNINNNTCDKFGSCELKKYNEIHFPLTTHNNMCIQRLSQIENDIIQYYNKFVSQNRVILYNKKCITIKHNLYNQKFKLYNEWTPTPSAKNKKNMFMLKISGIWEDEQNIGLTYKIIQVRELTR